MMGLTSFSGRVSVAPMMDWTDKHCRYFLRQISRQALLYTEMVNTGAIIHGDRDRFLSFNPEEHPLALQLGGSDPQALAECARIGADYGYDEINLNAGCPSDRVQSGRFGACLMAEPELVADCVAAMQDKVSIPVSVKTRIGIDEFDNYEFLHRFIETITATGCKTFIIHARKAWLKGLSPKQNREVPPLRYDIPARLKQDFPDLFIGLNGGVKTLDDAAMHLQTFDGVMIGREAYSNPWLLSKVDSRFFGDESNNNLTRHDVVDRIMPYLEQELSKGVPLARMTRHILGLFQGQPGARRWRRYLSEHAHVKEAEIDVVKAALEQLPEAA